MVLAGMRLLLLTRQRSGNPGMSIQPAAVRRHCEGPTRPRQPAADKENVMNSSYLMLIAMENDRLRTAQRYQRPAVVRREHAASRLRRALRHRAARTFTRRTATGAAA
jgi:hypothetical protein